MILRLVFSLLFFVFSMITIAGTSFAAVCAPTECSSQGKYICGSSYQAGDMCCTGGGCPSWICERGEIRDWSGDPPQCCYTEDVDNWVTKTCKGAWVDPPCVAYDYEEYDCKTTTTCTEWNTVCTNPPGGGGGGGGGPIPLGISDQKFEGEVLACSEICVKSKTTTTCKTKKVCVYDPPPYQKTYDCSYMETIEKGTCDNAVKSAGTCAYCGGTTGTSGGGTGGATCDPLIWGAWSACSVTCGGGTRSRVNDCGTFETQACNTQACTSTPTIRGYIWNATGQACTSSPSAGLEIVQGSGQGNVEDEITVTLDGSIQGTWDPDSFDGYSYTFPATTTGDHLVSANVPAPVGYANSSYRLACVNGTESGVATVNAQSNPTNLHLGYRIATTGWFQSIDGDVYGGCTEDSCANSVSVSIPDAGTILGGFADALVANIGTVFGNSGLSVTNSNFSEDENRHLEFFGSSDWWANTFTFTPPSSAQEISNCGSIFQGNNLEAGGVFTGDVSCVQDGLDGLNGNYNFSGDGVAVIYVTGTDTLTFNDDFTSSSDDRRVMFITQGPVEIAETIGTAAPSPSTEANIQASIISESGIRFLSDGLGTDLTVIMEGPLVTKDGLVDFSRDRGLDNGYPAQVVVYNPLYLVALSENTIPGVSAVDISWTIRN